MVAQASLLAELPVVLALGAGDLYLLQYPLRSAERPYAALAGLRCKKGSGRVEAALDPAVAGSWESFDRGEVPSLPGNAKRVLRSSGAHLHSQYAAAAVRRGVCYLTPVSRAAAMRPAPVPEESATNEGKTGAAAAAGVLGTTGMVAAATAVATATINSATVGGQKSEEAMQQLQVQVRRRETERQAEARMTSHQHLRELEAKEEWVELIVDSRLPSARLAAALGRSSAGGGEDEKATAHLVAVRHGAYLERLVGGDGAGGTRSEAATRREKAEQRPQHSRGLAQGANATLSRRLLEAMPLQERLRAVMAHAHVQALRFERLRRMVSATTSTCELLDTLASIAVIVQGHWIAKPEVRMMHELVEWDSDVPPAVYAAAERRVALRDYALLLFSRANSVSEETFVADGIPLAEWRVAAEGIGVVSKDERSVNGGRVWRFISTTDVIFNSAHEALVREHNNAWTQRAAAIVANANAAAVRSG